MTQNKTKDDKTPDAWQRFQDLTKRLLAVPKKEVEEVAEQQDDFRGKKRKKTPAKPSSKNKTKE